MYKTEQIIFLFIIIFSVLFLLLSGFIVFIIYRYKQKQNAHQQAMHATHITHENELLQARLEVQEQTFVNIAREIHDNVGQKLSFAKIQLVTLQAKGSAALQEPIDIIGSVMTDLSDLSRSLNADAMLANGLIHAVQFEVEQLQKTNLFAIDLVIKGETIFLVDKQEFIVYRIIQEALQNIVKHAAASEVHIVFTFEPTCLCVTVQDNGKGYDTTNKSKGQGLQNIKARAQLLGGLCTITSTINQGTIVTINLPIYAYNNQ
jgi:two-component system, NarL family, sensor kinase